MYDRNDALLDLLTSEDQCVKLLEALQRTGQQHVVNFITQNGGQKHNDVINLSIERSKKYDYKQCCVIWELQSVKAPVMPIFTFFCCSALLLHFLTMFAAIKGNCLNGHKICNIYHHLLTTSWYQSWQS